MEAPRVLIAIEPGMYAEVLAFTIGRHRPHAEVFILGPSEDSQEEVLRLLPHLVVANRVPKAAREGASFWIEVAKPQAGRGVEPLGAQISANGRLESVEEIGIAHVLGALDRAEEEILLREAARAEVPS
jgi:hypothetical protein